ncbi:MAG: hypothetical protein U9N85_00140 [Bacteroidota bacterium]|nr:hypothetical protein [Bacteroidota bacterium]
MAWSNYNKSGWSVGRTLANAKIEKPGTRERNDPAKAVIYKYRIIRAYVRYYLKYSPNVMNRMSMTELTEAFQDLLYVRSQRSRFEAEE